MKQLLYIVFLLTATACSLSEDTTLVEEGEVTLTFPIALSEEILVTTRTSVTDISIRGIDILVFDANKRYEQRIQVNNVSGDGAIKNFKVRMPARNQSTTFHIVANGRDENNADVVSFDALIVGMEESKAIALLQTQGLMVGKAPKFPLVMSGKTELASINSTTVIGNVNMLRTVASMYVKNGVNTLENGLSDFVITGFTLLQSAEKGRVIPNYNASFTNPTAVSLPSSLSYIDYADNAGTGTWGKATNATESAKLYLYERENVLDNKGLSVIVVGKYKGIEGYYKVWLKDNAGTAINIVRNHRYQIQITKVSGAGYPTFKEAVDAIYSANISTQILDDDDDITDIVVGSGYKLGLSSNAVQVAGSGAKSLAIVLNTNTDAKLVATADANWITDLKFTGVGNRQTMTANIAPTTSTRKGKVQVRAGNLILFVEVTQLAR